MYRICYDKQYDKYTCKYLYKYKVYTINYTWCNVLMDKIWLNEISRVQQTITNKSHNKIIKMQIEIVASVRDVFSLFSRGVGG